VFKHNQAIVQEDIIVTKVQQKEYILTVMLIIGVFGFVIINTDNGIKNNIRDMFMYGMVTRGYINGNQVSIGILDGVLFTIQAVNNIKKNRIESNRMENLNDIFNKFQDVNILIVGDIMLDSYIYGSVNRISPEAPVPILSKTEESFKLGGAGNVALNCKALGANPTIISYIGDDNYGEVVSKLLDESCIKSYMISNGKPTTVKKRIISGNTHLLRIDIEDTKDIIDLREDVMKYFISEISNNDVVILSDYNKGLLTHENISNLIDIAKDNNKIVVVDPKINNFKEYRGVDLIKPNLKELHQGLWNNELINEELDSVIKLSKVQMDVDSIMVTLSDKGIYWNGNEEFKVDSHKIELADPCGCGDTVISVASILKYLNIGEKLMVEISNVAGSMVCEHFGVVQVSNDELLERCIKLKLK